jgi:hypothetical protein
LLCNIFSFFHSSLFILSVPVFLHSKRKIV